MKTWMFALLEAVIAALGLAAYFWAEQPALATLAVVLAAILGIAQPLAAARKSRQLRNYHDRQFRKSVDSVEDQLKELRVGLIDPPLPHRPTVAVGLRLRFPQPADQVLGDYDRLVQALKANAPESRQFAAEFAERVFPWSIGPYLAGLAAFNAGDVEAAYQSFCAATAAQSGWVNAWLGWSAALDRLRRWDELREQHPHIRGVELLPYDAGDEATFIELSEVEREQLAEAFGPIAESLGNYYAIAEFQLSKAQIAASQSDFLKAA